MKDAETLSREHFNKQAAAYDETDTTYYSKNGKISCRDAVEHLSNVEYTSLLDIGCGTGYLIDLLSRQRSANYYGLDLAEEMIRMAESKSIAGTEKASV